eukprot:NODE_127_length_2579_cov_57.785481_g123_i0.p1 GENE.NODE_127_length_2579_cov_57.785481_g123_i0~~NODE_127_length_2579_cov_57.785481_g123_i0.p1  ORF type:complete len:805 (-),score=147.65 NODE_127_length_2579_cov_57.785481_g123_i0:55-2469(-)
MRRPRTAPPLNRFLQDRLTAESQRRPSIEEAHSELEGLLSSTVQNQSLSELTQTANNRFRAADNDARSQQLLDERTGSLDEFLPQHVGASTAKCASQVDELLISIGSLKKQQHLSTVGDNSEGVVHSSSSLLPPAVAEEKKGRPPEMKKKLIRRQSSEFLLRRVDRNIASPASLMYSPTATSAGSLFSNIDLQLQKERLAQVVAAQKSRDEWLRVKLETHARQRAESKKQRATSDAAAAYERATSAAHKRMLETHQEHNTRRSRASQFKHWQLHSNQMNERIECWAIMVTLFRCIQRLQAARDAYYRRKEHERQQYNAFRTLRATFGPLIRTKLALMKLRKTTVELSRVPKLKDIHGTKSRALYVLKDILRQYHEWYMRNRFQRAKRMFFELVARLQRFFRQHFIKRKAQVEALVFRWDVVMQQMRREIKNKGAPAGQGQANGGEWKRRQSWARMATNVMASLQPQEERVGTVLRQQRKKEAARQQSMVALKKKHNVSKSLAHFVEAADNYAARSTRVPRTDEVNNYDDEETIVISLLEKRKAIRKDFLWRLRQHKVALKDWRAKCEIIRLTVAANNASTDKLPSEGSGMFTIEVPPSTRRVVAAPLSARRGSCASATPSSATPSPSYGSSPTRSLHVSPTRRASLAPSAFPSSPALSVIPSSPQSSAGPSPTPGGRRMSVGFSLSPAAAAALPGERRSSTTPLLGEPSPSTTPAASARRGSVSPLLHTGRRASVSPGHHARRGSAVAKKRVSTANTKRKAVTVAEQQLQEDLMPPPPPRFKWALSDQQLLKLILQHLRTQYHC